VPIDSPYAGVSPAPPPYSMMTFSIVRINANGVLQAFLVDG